MFKKHILIFTSCALIDSNFNIEYSFVEYFCVKNSNKIKADNELRFSLSPPFFTSFSFHDNIYGQG